MNKAVRKKRSLPFGALFILVFAICLFQIRITDAQTFQWPVSPFTTTPTITQDYGCKGTINIINAVGDCFKLDKYHTGIDITMPTGSDQSVYASESGTVLPVVNSCGPGGIGNTCNGGWGNTVIIQHSNALYSMYAHLQQNSIPVINGQTVLKGIKIGVIGNTGNVTGTHLHFEIKNNGTLGSGYTTSPPDVNGYFDPWKYISTTAINPVPVKVVNSAGLNVRRGPNTSYSVFTTVNFDQGFVAFAKDGGWYRIYLPCNNSSCSGWIAGIVSGTIYSIENPSSTQVEVKNTGTAGLFVRPSPGSSLSLDKIWDGQRLVSFGIPQSALPCVSNWYQFFLPAISGAANGWSCGDYLIIIPGTDTTPPTAPSNLTATATSSSQINISWTASTDNIGVTGYRIERCQGVSCNIFTQIVTTNVTSYNDAGLTASTSYSYRVRAADTVGNLSAYSNIVSAITLAPPDTTKPTASTFSVTPSSLILGSVFTISWTVSDTGGSGLNRVELWRAPDNSGTPGIWAEITRTLISGNGPVSGSFTDAPTSAGSYWYGIHVVDNAGNWSPEPNPPGPIKVAVTIPFDFSLSTSPTSGSVTQGGSASTTITATLVSGSASAVSFSATGLPTGATASFTPTSCLPSCSSIMNITTFSTTPVGTHTITIIVAAGGGISKSITFTLTVTAQGVTLKKSLVLLVDFPDEAGQASKDFFQQIMFGTKPPVAPKGSFKDYYLETSYGKLQIDGQINNTTIAWIRLPQTSAYYAGGCYGITKPPDCAALYPQNAQKMVEDAVLAAKNLGLDFGPYDTDGDGIVDALFVVHAGRGGELSGNINDIWSHRWVAKTPINTGSVNFLGQPVSVYGYTAEPEYWNFLGDMTIGVFAHEYGHVLGLPDLYDIDSTSEGVGVWSLMASGNWNGLLGDTPAHIDAWSKYFLGWVTPTKVVNTLVNELIDQAETSSDVYQLLDGNPTTKTGEYFLVENRQKVNFDAGLPYSGILIWHIDESKATISNTDNANECYPGGPSCAVNHYRVALAQADNLYNLEKKNNRGDTGDPWPGSTAKTTFDATSSPNSNLYNGSSSGVSITNISASGPMMTATLTTNLQTFTITVTKAGTGSGTVTSSPAGISCGATCSASYNSGTSVTLTVAPAIGSTFAGWSGGGCIGTGTCTVTMTAATSVTATFNLADTTPPDTTITSGPANPTNSTSAIFSFTSTEAGSTFQCRLMSGAFASCTSPTSYTALISGPHTFNVKAIDQAGNTDLTPASQTWTIDLTVPTVSSTFPLNNATGVAVNSTISATFSESMNASTITATTFTLSSAASAVTGTVTYSGTMATFTPSASLAPSTTYTATITIGAKDLAGNAIAASYVWSFTTVQQFTLTVTKSGTGSGTVTSSPLGINCGVDCTEPYSSGTVVTLTAAPAIGSTFAGWSGGGCTGTGACTITMGSDTSVTATFDFNPGLKGEYYDNADLTNLLLTRTDPTINFDWITGSPDPAITPDTFSIRWTGKIKIDNNEPYTFNTITDDGTRLWIDGYLVIDYWQTGVASNNGIISLNVGLHNIIMEFFEGTGDALVQLYWSSPSTLYVIVPQGHLFPPDSAGNAPSLAWTGEAGYTSDGLEPQAGDTTTSFTYRIKYTDPDGDAPMAGYPRVHILKGGQEISGSPFAMTYQSGAYSTGAIYAYSTSLLEGTDYTYYFDAKDTTELQAVATPTTPTPTVPFNAPDVTSLPPPPSGDIDGSGRVDGFDLGKLGLAFGSKPGDPNWNLDADLNKDGIVDGSDLTILGANFGKTM